MSESLDSRKFDRKALFDVPLPMRKTPRDAPNFAGDDSGNEGTVTPPTSNTMAFSLMTKKGGRQMVRFLVHRIYLLTDSSTRRKTLRCPRILNLLSQ